MTDSDTALEHLEMIRTLMEKASVYRAVSAPTALFGGALATFLGGWLFWQADAVSVLTVLCLWLGAFVLINLFHHGLIWRTARREGEPYASPGLRMALKAIVPAMFAGGAIGFASGLGPAKDLVGATLAWITFYGIALLATSGFSPRSLRWVGFGFALTGSLTWSLYLYRGDLPGWDPQRWSAFLMMATFGVAHLVYGFAVRHAQRQRRLPIE